VALIYFLFLLLFKPAAVTVLSIDIGIADGRS
jgi:hypothetical protein